MSLRLFAGACALAVAFLFAPAVARSAELQIPAEANPPLWIVEAGDKKLYLFGSIHLLPPETKWRRAEIDAARAAAQVFVFEAPLGEGGQAMQHFIAQGGKLPEEQTLKDVLPAALHADMEKAAWQVHYPPKLLAPLRPWLAAVYLELYSYIKIGFSSYYGVDHVIEQAAREEGASFVYFETIEEQLSYFTKLDRKTEVAYLKATVEAVLGQPELPIELLNTWASGRTEALAALVDEGFSKVPSLRTKLIVARNRKWLPAVRRMLASEKTHFVTVGVGHLVGRDSLVALLRAKGYKVTGP
jgi:uncharacterized protein YbaP (TraB family)